MAGMAFSQNSQQHGGTIEKMSTTELMRTTKEAVYVSSSIQGYEFMKALKLPVAGAVYYEA